MHTTAVNKAIVDHNSPALCTPMIPSPHSRPILNCPSLQRTHYDALSVGKRTLKIAPSPWDFVTLLEKDRATAIDSMHKKLVKNRAWGSGDMLAYRQTDAQTERQTDRSAYHNTSPRSHGQSNECVEAQ